MPRQFTIANVVAGQVKTIYCEQSDLIDAPLDWQKMGLQQTVSGYGCKLTTRYKINFNGKLYRVYATCFSNAASHWFTAHGETIFIN